MRVKGYKKYNSFLAFNSLQFRNQFEYPKWKDKIMKSITFLVRPKNENKITS